MNGKKKSISPCRAAFEAWIESERYSILRENSDLWVCWQAATAAADARVAELEECNAKVAADAKEFYRDLQQSTAREQSLRERIEGMPCYWKWHTDEDCSSGKFDEVCPRCAAGCPQKIATSILHDQYGRSAATNRLNLSLQLRCLDRLQVTAQGVPGYDKKHWEALRFVLERALRARAGASDE